MKTFKNKYINKALESLGFKELTDVQEKVIPLLDDHKDLVVEANTGSGKTHAFLLPIFDHLDPDNQSVQALILAPTRDLATQIYNFAMEIANHSDKQITIDLFIGGVDRDEIIRKLNTRMPHIAIGTPGRISDLIVKENLLKAYKADYFIIDEADMTLEGDFMEPVGQIMGVIQENCCKAVFSATISESLKPFLRKYLSHPVMIDVHPQDIASLNIEHYFIKTREQKRFVGLKKTIEPINHYLAPVF